MRTALVYDIISLSANSLAVIPIVLAVRFLLKKRPKGYSYALWSVVFFSLVFNARITLPHSSEIPTPVADAQHRIQQQYTRATFTAADVPLPENTAPEADITLPPRQDTSPQPGTVQPAVKEEKQLSLGRLAGSYILFVHKSWSLVALVLFLWFLFTILRTNENLTTDLHYKDNIYLTESFDTPFVFGFVHPKIYIPADLRLKDLSYIVAHEKHHIKRKDYIIKPLALLICIVHWFNPLVWLSYCLMCRDMEMSCDEAVIRQFNGGKKEYSTLLLDFATGKGLQTAVMFGESHSESRIKNVLKYRKPAKAAALVLSIVVFSTIIVPLVKTGTADVTEDFYTAFDRVATTEGVQYKKRQSVYQHNNVLYTADGPATDSGFYFFNEDTLGNDHLLPYEKIVGVRIDDHPDGEFFALGCFGENATGLSHYHFLNGESTGSGWSSIRKEFHRINKMVSYDFLGDGTLFTAYYTEKYSDKDKDYKTDALNIKRQYERPSTALENLQRKLSFVSDDDAITTTSVTEYYSLPVSEVGEYVRGVRFFNENLGFIAYTLNPYEDPYPLAKITVDGGKTWQDIDFSQLALPFYFTGYSACCMEMYGDMIEIRVKVRSTDTSPLMLSGTEPYSLISYDCGRTWAGYGHNIITDDETGKTEKHYYKLTDTIPLTIISESTQTRFRTQLDSANNMDSTQYSYRMAMDHFSDSGWYSLRPGHTWLEDKPLYPDSVLEHKRPADAESANAQHGMGVVINDNPEAPAYSFLNRTEEGRYMIKDYNGIYLSAMHIFDAPEKVILGHDKISDSLYYSHIGGATYKTENGNTSLLHISPVTTVYRGIKYLNRNVAVKSTRLPAGFKPDYPSASITLDGGYTWQQLDFSQLKLPREEYGSDCHYGGCIVLTYGETIEIRYHVRKLMEKGYTLEDNYSIISQDGGMTWAGYLRTTGTQQNKPDQPGFHYIKVTQTIPATIKTAPAVQI